MPTTHGLALSAGAFTPQLGECRHLEQRSVDDFIVEDYHNSGLLRASKVKSAQRLVVGLAAIALTTVAAL